jgi:Skp family chaperone for outer membrane proteins
MTKGFEVAMKKILLGSLLLSAAMVVNAEEAKKPAAAVVNVQQATKIGFVSTAAVLGDSSLGKKLKKELDEKYETIAKSLQEKEQEIIRLGNELQAKKSSMSEQAFASEQTKAQEMVRKYEALRQEKGEEFRAVELKANERLVKETLEVAATVGKQGGYDAIVDKDSGKVLWTAEKVDCTKNLIVGLDKKFVAETTKVASASTKKSA